ncbi:MAG TPA: cell division protein SepF, partial [Bacillota bacterium]
RAVLVNLEGADRDLAHRITNFLSGTIYALNGEMHAITPAVLFFAPGGVNVSVEGRPPVRDPRGTPGT